MNESPDEYPEPDPVSLPGAGSAVNGHLRPLRGDPDRGGGATPTRIVADLGRLGHKTFRVLSRGNYRVWGNARGSRFVGRLLVGVARTIVNPDA